ncbi:inhibitor of nuclear factor kappa B kinase subunit beta isoform X2 [Xylocopa sonorina]|uniref:inhibitor of nuclear factor kappa B kinase subunit beta isoform X2 n=1 Tax=Xylocopa sonorina TaxID=1818115 RepID=UPI00403ADBCE
MTAKPDLIQEWSLDKVLGSGGFGVVELWVHKSGEKLAIKICKKDITQLTEAQQKRWINEIQIMKRFNHPNIVKGLEIPFKHPDDQINLPLLCMEFCRKGDLRMVLNKVENCCGVSEKEAIDMMKDISSAIEYLHSNNITHRDLKPENIVLQDKHDGILYKLIDLGFAKELGEDSITGSLVGTLNYVAPELLWKQTYSCSVDYWSLGILFHEIVTGVRPFLPKMQHTMSWMQHIRNKEYNDICAFKSEGKIVFSQNVRNPTNLSRNLQNKLAEWFRIVLQWDPKKRGKQYDENGTSKLVVFKLLHSILSNQIVHVFCTSTYKINAYEITDTTRITDLQCMIAEDTNIPINQQRLTDYFGNILIENRIPVLSQIKYRILFVFKTERSLLQILYPENIPSPDIHMEIQKMIKMLGNQLDMETLQDYYRVTIFFMKQEIYLFQLYIFAITIKTDLAIARVNTCNENMTKALTNITVLSNEVSTAFAKYKEKSINKERVTALENNCKKVTKLVDAANQIKLKFDSLTQESNKLKDAVQSLDCIQDISEVYNKAVKVYELCKDEHSHKYAQPTRMVKLFFEFLKTRERQCLNATISDIIRQITSLEKRLVTLETILNSVIAMTKIYHEELQNIIKHISNDMLGISSKDYSNPSNGACKTVKPSLNNDTRMSINNECSTSNQFSNASIIRHKEIMDTDNDVIYDNLVIRNTLDLLIKTQKKYMELLRLEL